MSLLRIERSEVKVTASTEAEALDKVKDRPGSPIRISSIGKGSWLITLERLPRGDTRGFCE